MAYDVASGNPYKKYSPLDFKLGNRDAISIALSKDTAMLKSCKENSMELEVSGAPFKINVTGFDFNRDLKVKLVT